MKTNGLDFPKHGIAHFPFGAHVGEFVLGRGFAHSPNVNLKTLRPSLSNIAGRALITQMHLQCPGNKGQVNFQEF